MDRPRPGIAVRPLVALVAASSLAACSGAPHHTPHAGRPSLPPGAPPAVQPDSQPDSQRGGMLTGLSERQAAAPKGCTVSAKLVPSCGAWWGVTPTLDHGRTALTATHGFEREIGRSVDLYHGYHRGDGLFPTAPEIALAHEPGKHRKLVLNWKPDSGKTWRQVAAGAMDAQIARESAYLKSHFTDTFWLVIHHEPENEVNTAAGSGETAADYRAMFRHVVSRFRANHVHNALFTIIYEGYSGWVVKPWFKHLYPGSSYVDWVGYDPYAKSNTKDFPSLVNKVAGREQGLGFPGFYDYAAKHFPNKPLMLSEWGVVAIPGDPARKAAFFRDVGRELRHYPRIKALAYYDNDHAANMPDGGDTSIDTTPAALRAFRALGRLPLFNVRG